MPDARPLKTHVLVIGVSPDDYDAFYHAIKNVLLSQHAGWDLVANQCCSFDHVIHYLRHHDDVDVILVMNQVNRKAGELTHGTARCIPWIAHHPSRPHVALEGGLEFLFPLLKDGNIDASIGKAAEHVIVERHQRLSHADIETS